MTVDDYLKSVGKKCFIDYYELFQDFSIDRQSLISELKKKTYLLHHVIQKQVMADRFSLKT